jgi:hypothetical protein
VIVFQGRRWKTLKSPYEVMIGTYSALACVFVAFSLEVGKYGVLLAGVLLPSCFILAILLVFFLYRPCDVVIILDPGSGLLSLRKVTGDGLNPVVCDFSLGDVQDVLLYHDRRRTSNSVIVSTRKGKVLIFRSPNHDQARQLQSLLERCLLSNKQPPLG